MQPSALQGTLPLDRHRNHYLFSDYYLNRRIQERREWQDAEVGAVFDALATLWQERKAALVNANEGQTEADWIRPVLRQLGHHFAVQVAIQAQGGSKTPDYVLCPDEASRAAIQTLNRPASEADLRGALAVADAKAWDRPLDRTTPQAGVRSLHANPALQIDFYVRHSGLPWGILSNGRLWRLYHRESSKKLDVFYEVDLPALLEAGDLEAFKYFWLFFRREAFSGGVDAPGAPAWNIPRAARGWLELVLGESLAFQRGISQGLKEQVYEALQALAQGFLDFPGNGLEATPATLQAIHDNSLIVLYRLLFLFYAEDRELLPLRESQVYRESYSLFALKRRIAGELATGQPAAPSMDTYWHQLRQLWRVIDHGDEFLGVPAYNGGLFKPANHPFLERYRVGDLHLRRAIDLLARARDPKTGQREFVDYRDLEIRHLGSIYEGLLEYHVQVEDGQVSLLNDKGERKATGSYYTPDYIVQYIVEQTVGPVLAEAAAPYRDRDGQASDPAGLAGAILDIDLLDPAMGSGHFLVAAAEFIARFAVESGLVVNAEAPAADYEGELAYWRRRVAQVCIYGVDLNPLAVELAKLSLWLATVSRDKPLSFLDHHLRCGNSLIGARVADLPLDPARPNAAQKRKAGKARQAEAAAHTAGQLSMLDDSAFAGAMRTATGFMDQIEALGSETLADVQESERIYLETVRKTTEKARLLADLWTSRHFGLDLDQGAWPALARYVLHGGIALPGWEQTIERAREIAGERRFFHWELEFPEVFFDRHGRLQGESAGFDAVIGNPPYVRQEELGAIKPYLATAHSDVYHGVADLYVYFISTGVRMLGRSRQLGYITSGTFRRLQFGSPLRRFISKSSSVRQVVDLARLQVFDDVTAYPIILVLESGSDSQSDQVLYADVQTVGELRDLKRSFLKCDPPIDDDEWFFVPPALKRVLRGWEGSVALRDLLASQIHRGVTTGANEVFVVEDDLYRIITSIDDRSREIIKPYVRGEDLRPWIQTDTSLWLVFTRRGLDVDAYPGVKRYLETHRHRLEPKPLDWPPNLAWPGRKQGSYAWFEIQDSVDYFPIFEAPRIFSTKVSLKPAFSFSDKPLFGGNTTYVLPIKSAKSAYVLLCILNSRLAEYYYRQVFTPKANGYYEVQPEPLERFPIPNVLDATPDKERQNLVQEARRRYEVPAQDWQFSAEPPVLDPVLAFVSEQLDAEPERSDVVHDLLAFLAGQMIDLNKQRQKLEKALDPFKFLDRGAAFQPLTKVFAEGIKYGELVRHPDLGAVRHDVEALRLEPLNDGRVELQAYLKHRDPASDWDKWQYDEAGGILRTWTPVYRFDLDPTMARFYGHALPVLDQFANYKKFSGGKTNSTLKKLQAGKLPAFDPAADLGPLEELQAELAAVRRQIEHTDRLIDQIVYQLYGLTDDEIAIVEGG